jgi:hypothetical protein
LKPPTSIFRERGHHGIVYIPPFRKGEVGGFECWENPPNEWMIGKNL